MLLSVGHQRRSGRAIHHQWPHPGFTDYARIVATVDTSQPGVEKEAINSHTEFSGLVFVFLRHLCYLHSRTLPFQCEKHDQRSRWHHLQAPKPTQARRGWCLTIPRLKSKFFAIPKHFDP